MTRRFGSRDSIPSSKRFAESATTAHAPASSSASDLGSETLARSKRSTTLSAATERGWNLSRAFAAVPEVRTTRLTGGELVARSGSLFELTTALVDGPKQLTEVTDLALEFRG